MMKHCLNYSCVRLQAILVFSWITYDPVEYNGADYESWALIAGWVISFVPIAAVPITALVQICMAHGSFTQVSTVLNSFLLQFSYMIFEDFVRLL